MILSFIAIILSIIESQVLLLLLALTLFSGLVHLYRSVPLQTQPHDEPKTQSVMPEEYALMGITSQPEPKQEPQPQPLSLVTTGRVTMNPDILSKPSFTLVSKHPTSGGFKGTECCLKNKGEPCFRSFVGVSVKCGVEGSPLFLASAPASKMSEFLVGDVVEFVGDKPATLDWLETAIKPDILDATEPPNVIEMARLSLPLVQVFGGGQSERDLTRLGIRELKKRASAAKIKHYNVMTKTQLIDQLFALDKLTA